MAHVVVDASVAAKWALDEELADEALSIYVDALKSGTTVAAPVILPAEVTNAVYQQHRRGALTVDDAGEALRRFLEFSVKLVEPPGELYERALAFARLRGLRSIYDSVYLMVAEALDADLWTADGRFFNAAVASTARLRWLGDYRLNTPPERTS